MHLKKITIFFVFLLGVLAWSTFVLSPHLSPDSYQYLSSGKSLLDKTYLQNYFFVREPGYPVLIAIVLFFGGGLKWIVAFQAIFLFISYFLLLQEVKNITFVQHLGKWGNAGLFFATFWAFIYLGGYAALIGQQVIISSALFLLVALILNTIRKNRNLVFFLLLSSILSVFAASVSAPLGLFFALTCSIATFRLFYQNNWSKNQRINSNKQLLITVLSLLIPMFFVVSFMFSWNKIVDLASSKPGFNIENFENPHFQNSRVLHDWEFIMNSNYSFPIVITTSLASNLNLVPPQGWAWSIVLEKGIYSSQSDTLGYRNTVGQGGCTQLPDKKILVVSPEYIPEFINYCPQFIQLVPPTLDKVILAILHAIWVVLLAISIILLIRKQNMQVNILTSIALGLSIFYALFLGGIDRYGSPGYPLISIAGSIYLFAEIRKIKLRFS